jgi:hypothetical protein
VAYTLGKTMGQNFNFNPARPGSAWDDRPEASTQFHNLIVDYTWDVPNGSPLMAIVSNFSMFKKFGLGGSRKLQIRWEMYNVFNQVNWSALDVQARFNPRGSR